MTNVHNASGKRERTFAAKGTVPGQVDPGPTTPSELSAGWRHGNKWIPSVTVANDRFRAAGYCSLTFPAAD